MPGTDDSRTTREEDDEVEALVLTQLIHLHPIRLTVAELVLELAGERATFKERDAVERAVRDLAAAGLVHHADGPVEPTRAALRSSQLLDR